MTYTPADAALPGRRETGRAAITHPAATPLPAGWLGAIVAAMLLCGCDDAASRSAAKRRPAAAAAAQSSSSHLQQALGLLQRIDEFTEAQAAGQVAYHLNRWIEGQKAASDWAPDPLIKSLPARIRDGAAVQQLSRPQFHRDDIRVLMQAAWMDDVAGWVARQPIAGGLGEWSQAHAASLPSSELQQLTAAERLFDWTVRSVALDELLAYRFEAARPAADSADTTQHVPPPLRGEPGPGYQFYPWQALLYGHGDALSRARVFMQLARQRRIDVVMLAFPGRTTPPRPRPWLPAAVIGDQLYLFDARLGLPIPSPRGSGIATLAEVRENPGWLSSLDVGTQFEYPVNERDLQSVLVMIDAAPQDLSRRMYLLERQLSGDHRLVLTTPAADLAARLKKLPGISEVTLWPIAYETDWFQTAIHSKLENVAKLPMQEQREVRAFFERDAVFALGQLHPLVRARYRHFREELENKGDSKGAKTLYLEARVPNASIEQLQTSAAMQQQFGLERRGEEPEVFWQIRVESVQKMIAMTKQHANFFLGLAQYDGGRYEAALDWLARRTLEPDPEGPWAGAARYNLGRTHEALDDVETAREIYLQDVSPQSHGNRLRARLLAQAAETPPAPAQ